MRVKTFPKKLNFQWILPLFFVPVFLIVSCAVPKKSISPIIAIPNVFSQTGSAFLPEKWWTAFNDVLLNKLIDEALSDNLNIQIAWDRLEQAKAVARKSGAESFPNLNGSVGASKTTSKTFNTDKRTVNNFSIGVGASYELDLWGRVRNSIKATELDVLASQEDLYAAAISLTSEIAILWYKLIEQQIQLELIDRQIKTNEKYLDLITFRFKNGKTSIIDIFQQRQSLEVVKVDKIIGEANKKIIEHQLAILLGKPSKIFILPKQIEFPELPLLPATGLPAKLIKKRPDIRKAYFRVQAEDKRVAVAIADRFPKLSLSANAETSSAEINNLFQNWFAVIAGNLIAPLFDGGRRTAEADRTKAVYSEAIHAYGQTILKSLKEVEDALVHETRQRKLIKSLQKQLELSQASADQTREKYICGAMDFLRVLTALLSYQNLERNYIRAQRELIEHRINLCRALAGSWTMNRKLDFKTKD